MKPRSEAQSILDTLRKNPFTQAFLGVLIIIVILLLGSSAQNVRAEEQAATINGITNEQLASFETDLDAIRQVLKIPGMSAAVVQDQEIIWSAGFGYADLENQVKATPDTPYSLASVTKPVAAVLFMQLVEEELIDLDTPLSEYGIDTFGSKVTSRHLLTHTSEGTPGTVHDYNGNRYSYLGGVMERTTGQSFAALLSERILLPLGLHDTALNPMSMQFGQRISSLADFQIMTGLGENFRHYPGVYANLTKPYQFDEDYEIIPGMYHLYHGPAAGLLSTVIDLAKFDIALDQGLLLGEDAKAEMFSPAISTYENREDLNYGLGWYVQDFYGTRMLWHTGRWSPSTSGLYLKVPDKDLTLIVLANTDNLTVPFYGIGNGDVSTSTLVLSFFRHLIYPEEHNAPLPVINWEASLSDLVSQFKAVEDPAAKEFLERVLWSYRQAYASAGDHATAERLLQVNRRAYPGSVHRGNELLTNLPGQYPVIPPVPRAITFTRIGWVTVAWILLVLVSAIWMVFRLIAAKQLSTLCGINWLLAALFLGPIAILVHIRSHPVSGKKAPSNWGRTFHASALVTTGYSAAWVLALVLVTCFGGDPHPLVILGSTYLVPIILSLLIFRSPLLAKQTQTRYQEVVSRSVLTEFITFNIGFAVYFLVTMLMVEHLLTTIPTISSPFFWALIFLVSSAGLVFLVPVHYWMRSRGYTVPSTLEEENDQAFSSPTLKKDWTALLISIVVLVAALVILISNLG